MSGHKKCSKKSYLHIMGEGWKDQNQIKNKILGSDFYRGSKNSQTLKEKEKRSKKGWCII